MLNNKKNLSYAKITSSDIKSLANNMFDKKHMPLYIISPINIKTIIESKDRSKASATAPAHGLYLLKVEY